MTDPVGKAALGPFLAANPFSDPLTLGLFYREKMRALHRIAPDLPFRRILEVGGGTSGLTSRLYPGAEVANLDLEPAAASGRTFPVKATATAMPFAESTFEAVTLFDVIEHVEDDARLLAEARRVLIPGGWLLLSTPSEDWRFPAWRLYAAFCPTEREIMAEWGHLRRGYARGELERLVGAPAEAAAGFLGPVTAINHDLAFSRLPHRLRKLLSLLIAPPTWLAYATDLPRSPRFEWALAWRL